MALRSISVDLDSLPHYCRIQGLPESLLDQRARELVWRVAVPRYLELFDQVGVRGTFFAIGEDLADDGCGKALKASHHAGVEIASHSFAHDYAISRRAPEVIAADLRRAHEAIERAVGAPPVGFRAPGYTLSPALLQAVEALGYRYDSSAFPAAPYYLAKASVMGALQLLGRPSRSILDSPTVLLAPRQPYRPSLSAPYQRGGAQLLELPMAVAPITRLPFIGTFVTSLPWPLVNAVWRQVRSGFVNFELHAIDVLDERDGIPEVLCRQQRDLKVPVKQKLKRLRQLFGEMKQTGEVLTLEHVARRPEFH